MMLTDRKVIWTSRYFKKHRRKSVLLWVILPVPVDGLAPGPVNITLEDQHSQLGLSVGLNSQISLLIKTNSIQQECFWHKFWTKTCFTTGLILGSAVDKADY